MSHPRMPGLHPVPIPDSDTVIERQFLGKTPPRYSSDHPTYRFKVRTFEGVGMTGMTKLVKEAKEYYKAKGLAVRVKKHEAKSYGVYWDIYVGSGKWREYVSSSRLG